MTSYGKTIGRFDPASLLWSEAGKLNQGRYTHNAIYEGSNIVVVGGVTGSLNTEVCTVANGEVSCTLQSPALTDFAFYPELFLITVDFCKNWPYA